MSTTIICNQIALSFDIDKIIAAFKTNNPNIESMSSYYDHMIKDYSGNYFFLIEENYSSNCFPKTPSWYSSLGVRTEHDLMCEYIKVALCSFEGGVVTFKGKRSTTPETALRRVRKTIKQAIPYDEFISWSNANKLSFSISFDRKKYDQYFIDNKEVSMEHKALLDKLNLTFESNNHWIHSNILINTPDDILKVIVLTSLSSRIDSLSTPSAKASCFTIMPTLL